LPFTDVNKRSIAFNSPFYNNQVNPLCRVSKKRRALSRSIPMPIVHLLRDIEANMFVPPHKVQIFVAPSVAMRSRNKRMKKINLILAGKMLFIFLLL
jgi:hypothetical protein